MKKSKNARFTDFSLRLEEHMSRDFKLVRAISENIKKLDHLPVITVKGISFFVQLRKSAAGASVSKRFVLCAYWESIAPPQHSSIVNRPYSSFPID